MAPLVDSDYCWNHDPARAADRAEARRLGGYNRRTPRADPAGEFPSLRTMGDVVREAEWLLAETRLRENSARRTQAIVPLLALAVRIVEGTEIERRLRALEDREDWRR